MRQVDGVWKGAFCMVLFLAPACVAAAEPRLEDLQERVAVLEKTVKSLQLQISILAGAEKSQPAAAEAPAVATGNPRDRRNWRQLTTGMTMEQVRALLGEPEHVTAGGYWTHWYWQQARGFVSFRNETKRVDTWSEP